MPNASARSELSPARDIGRTEEQALDALTWTGPARQGGELRFYDLEGKPLTPEQVAERAPDQRTSNAAERG